MGDTHGDPTDHSRTTQPRAGIAMKDNFFWPGLLLLVVAIGKAGRVEEVDLILRHTDVDRNPVPRFGDADDERANTSPIRSWPYWPAACATTSTCPITPSMRRDRQRGSTAVPSTGR